MTDPGQVDVEAFLTEVGVSPDEADPTDSVGNTTILHTDRAATSLPRYSPAAGEGAVQVSLAEMLAEGQVTAVYRGHQHSMRRDIAVRTVHHTRRTPAAPGRVISDGWMQGALEHPNVIPVYGVGTDHEGLPLVLMKSVDTVPWSTVLGNEDHRLASRGRDPLGAKIRRMLEVCRALEYAHHRGILHRDVKPDNILLDREGNLYLHGWSLAVALVKDASGRFPLASEQTQIAGTPAYMAPELATKNIRAISVATDVYLAGATLHHVVTGEPRHVGENVFDAFYSAVNSTPVDYSDDIPDELAEILNKAMAHAPEDRHDSIAELRHSLERFLGHRAAHRLNAQAAVAETEFQRAVSEELDDYIVRELFATTFTIYQQALREWARNQKARERLDTIVRRMIDYELERGSRARARDLLTRLAESDPELERRVQLAAQEETARERRKAHLEARERSANVDESRGRARFMIANVVVWTLFGVVFALAETTGLFQPTLPRMVIAGGIGWLVVGAAGALQGESLFRGLTARYVLAPVAVIMVGSVTIIGYFVSQEPSAYGDADFLHQIVNFHHLLFFAVMATVNAFYDWRLIVSSAAYLLAFIGGTTWPDQTFWFMAAANFVALSWSGALIHRTSNREQGL